MAAACSDASEGSSSQPASLFASAVGLLPHETPAVACGGGTAAGSVETGFAADSADGDGGGWLAGSESCWRWCDGGGRSITGTGSVAATLLAGADSAARGSELNSTPFGLASMLSMYIMHWQNRQSATSDQTRLRAMCPNARGAPRGANFFAKIHGTEADFVVRAGSRVRRGRFLCLFPDSLHFCRIFRGITPSASLSR